MQLWWVKKRRAANPTDYESWQQGGVSPTLNAFDNGHDTRATVIIGQLFEPQSMKEENWVDRDIKNSIRAGESKSSHVIVFTAQRVGEPPRIYEDITPSLLSRMGTGGNNTPMIVQNNPSHDVVGTLQARMHKGANHEAARDGQLIPTTVLNFDEYNFTGSDDIHHAIQAGTKQSTGVVIAFAQNQRDEVRDLNDLAGALQAQPGMKQQTFLAIPIQDGREIEKHQNGLGVAEPGAPAYTIDTTGAQSVGIVAPTLTATNNPSRSPQATEVTQQIEAVYQAQTVVRRLTPVECERLMGWPDNHTLHRADGKTNSDSARYKMCGNGVATPVAHWIAEQLRPLLEP